MKGIILAGGKGTRLYPATLSISKQLLPIYDKPMIYYPLSVLMLSGIKEILIISTETDLLNYKKLLGNGDHLGLKISYQIQHEPKGIAEAFLIGKEFIDSDSIALILGDNFFYGQGLKEQIQNASKKTHGATIFGYYVRNPSQYGVAEIDNNLRVVSIEEKPEKPKSNYAITGLYFYDNSVLDIAMNIQPSIRGELEITDINNVYIKRNELDMEILGRGVAWLDMGTHDALNQASRYVEVIEKRQGLKIACVEEIAYRMGYINTQKLKEIGLQLKDSSYGKYLLALITEEFGYDM